MMRRLLVIIATSLIWPSAAVAQDAVWRFIPPDAFGPVAVLPDTHVLLGRLDAWEGTPDFFCRQGAAYSSSRHPLADGTPKCYARSMILGDIGDAPDLILRRAGPDGARYNSRPEPTDPQSSLGGLYWQAWGGHCQGGYGWAPGCGGNGRTAQIYSRTVGEQTATSRAGSLASGDVAGGQPWGTHRSDRHQ